MPSYRPSPEQYAAMIEAAQAAGQPLPKTHVSLQTFSDELELEFNTISDEWKTKNCSNVSNRLRT
jgi:hypothetical protein